MYIHIPACESDLPETEVIVIKFLPDICRLRVFDAAADLVRATFNKLGLDLAATDGSDLAGDALFDGIITYFFFVLVINGIYK